MTTTARVLVSDALKELKVLAEGDTATGTMADDALRALNRLMEILSNNQSFAYYPVLVQRSLTGESSFTVGPTGNVVTARPINIESAYVTYSGLDYPVRVVDNQLWDGISNKATTGSLTEYVWYEGTMSNGIVHVAPLASGVTLNLRVITLVATFATLDTVLTLPPGYEECLMSNLAVRLSPQYPAGALSPITERAARTSLKTIQRKNNVIPTQSLPGIVVANTNGMSWSDFIGST